MNQLLSTGRQLLEGTNRELSRIVVATTYFLGITTQVDRTGAVARALLQNFLAGTARDTDTAVHSRVPRVEEQKGKPQTVFPTRIKTGKKDAQRTDDSPQNPHRKENLRKRPVAPTAHTTVGGVPLLVEIPDESSKIEAPEKAIGPWHTEDIDLCDELLATGVSFHTFKNRAGRETLYVHLSPSVRLPIEIIQVGYRRIQQILLQEQNPKERIGVERIGNSSVLLEAPDLKTRLTPQMVRKMTQRGQSSGKEMSMDEMTYIELLEKGVSLHRINPKGGKQRLYFYIDSPAYRERLKQATASESVELKEEKRVLKSMSDLVHWLKRDPGKRRRAMRKRKEEITTRNFIHAAKTHREASQRWKTFEENDQPVDANRIGEILVLSRKLGRARSKKMGTDIDATVRGYKSKIEALIQLGGIKKVPIQTLEEDEECLENAYGEEYYNDEDCDDENCELAELERIYRSEINKKGWGRKWLDEDYVETDEEKSLKRRWDAIEDEAAETAS